MAFFRKSKNSETSIENSNVRAEALANQAKWDELERLVNTEPAPAETPSAAPVNESDTNHRSEKIEIEAKQPVQSLNIKTQESQYADAGSFNAGLKVDIPTDTNFVDVTPPARNAAAEASITAMLPSEHLNMKSASNADGTNASLEQQAQTEEEVDRFIPPLPPVHRSDRADIGGMRLDVARISADIQSGEELYRRAQQRIENLTSFVERAEIDFSMLNRLEPENRRLKARNRTIQREIDANVQKIKVLRASLEDHEQRLAEKTRIYDEMLGNLSSAQHSVKEYERALNETRDNSDRNALKSEQLQTALDVERRENTVLRTRLTDTINEMEGKKTAYIEAKKIADSLAQDCSDFRQQAESAEKEADALRRNLATAQTQNNAIKAEMIALHEDIRSFKTQSEFTILSREDEVSALKQQINHLSKQLEIKDEIVKNAARDIQDLRKVRTAQDQERERLEAQIDAQSYQLDQANADLLKSKQDVSDFDKRYRDVATALSVAHARRMSNEPAETPDIQPVPTAPVAESVETAPADTTDNTESLTSDEIGERIMDYRLGLRNEIS